MSFGLIWRLYKHKNRKKTLENVDESQNARGLGVDNFILLV